MELEKKEKFMADWIADLKKRECWVLIILRTLLEIRIFEEAAAEDLLGIDKDKCDCLFDLLDFFSKVLKSF